MKSEILTPELEYKCRKDMASNKVAQLEIFDRNMSILRAVLFVVFCVVTYLCFFVSLLSWPWIAIPIVAFTSVVFVHSGVSRKLATQKRVAEYYRKCLSRLGGHWRTSGATGERYCDNDHAYSGDLDIFGKESLFQLLSLARTRMGEDTLASWLKNSSNKEEIELRQQAIEELRLQLDEREVFGLLDDKPLPDQVDENGLLYWAQQPFGTVSNSVRITAVSLSLLTLTAIFTYLYFDIGPSILLLAILLQVVVFRSFKLEVKSVEQEVDRVSTRLRMLILILQRLEAHSFESLKLKKNCESLYTMGLPPSIQVARLEKLIHYLSHSLRNSLLVLPAAILGTPVHLIHAIARWHAEVSRYIPKWLAAVGEYEALSSLAGYAYEHPEDSFPAIVSTRNCLIGKQLGHPLLTETECIRNDIIMQTPLSLVMISGSNMSGKSTLLRTVGINMVLAFSGSVVRATSLHLSAFSPMTCMRVNDSLQKHTSYFYAVISRIKLILDSLENSTQVFFLLDEILSGTNSYDRRIGAEKIISKLIHNGAIGLVTTHDLALTNIVNKLGTSARNMHFEDQLTDGVMSFDYKIKDGIVNRSNALELMRLVGIDVS